MVSIYTLYLTKDKTNKYNYKTGEKVETMLV